MIDFSFISWRHVLGLVCSLCWSVAGHAADAGGSAADASPATAAAVWKEQEINFHYQSFTTFYSCQALEDRVTSILTALGADKKTLRVRSSGCEMGRIARVPFLRIKMVSPVEATPKVLAELAATRSTRELASRVRGERPPEADEQFDAHWKPVSLFRGGLRLDPADCQLVDQLQREVFPKMGVRVVKDQVNCSPNQSSLGTPRLDVEALFPVNSDANAPAAAPEKARR